MKKQIAADSLIVFVFSKTGDSINARNQFILKRNKTFMKVQSKIKGGKLSRHVKIKNKFKSVNVGTKLAVNSTIFKRLAVREYAAE